MTIYDDILPVRPTHMNEDPYSSWKQCENRKCGRIFHVPTEGMHVLHFDIRPDYPKDSLFPMKKIYCLTCGKVTERHCKEIEEDRANGDLVPCCACGEGTYTKAYAKNNPNKIWPSCDACIKEFNLTVNELNKRVVVVTDDKKEENIL